MTIRAYSKADQIGRHWRRSSTLRRSVAPPEPHPALEPLTFLLGTWRGGGAGHYPTIEPFEYVEEISFVHVGKPWLLYTQRTRHAVEDRPLHAETGYFGRPATASWKW